MTTTPRRTKRIVALAAAAALAVQGVAVPAMAAAPKRTTTVFDGDNATTSRIAGSDGRATAIEVSRARFPEGRTADAVIVSRDDVYVDALTGSSLTGWGPMLFVQGGPNGRLDAANSAEIDRVLESGGTIYVVGGPNAVSTAIESSLQGIGTVERLSGPSRFETATAIANELLDRRAADGMRRIPKATILARSNPRPGDSSGTSGWVDAIAAGGPAAYHRLPILLAADPSTGADAHLPAVTKDWIEQFTLNQMPDVIIAGGPAALDINLHNDSTIRERGARRIAGPDRAATAMRLASWGMEQGPQERNRRYVVIDGHRADGWMYGLASAGLSADTGAPVVLVNGTGSTRGQQSGSVKTQMVSCDGRQVDTVYVGGTGVITGATVTMLEGLDGSCTGSFGAANPDAFVGSCEMLTYAEANDAVSGFDTSITAQRAYIHYDNNAVCKWRTWAETDSNNVVDEVVHITQGNGGWSCPSGDQFTVRGYRACVIFTTETGSIVKFETPAFNLELSVSRMDTSSESANRQRAVDLTRLAMNRMNQTSGDF